MERKKTLKQRFMKEIRQNWELYLFVSIPLAYLIIFKYVPMYGVQIAFRDFKPGRSITGSEWVGLKHFIRFLSDYRFGRIIWNTVAISLYQLCTFPLPIILALLLNYIKNAKFKKVVQMVTYAPHFISTVVMVGIINRFFNMDSGAISRFISLLGGEVKNFLSYPEYFRDIYVWSGVWQGVGYGAIIYIAALSGVSPELHEAAIVDGANILQRIRYVDIPSILPTIAIMLIMECGSILGVGYEKIYLLQNSLNIDTSEVISTYVYKQGLASSVPQYSYSTAVGLFISIINMILLLIVNKITDKLSGNSLF